MRSCAVVPAQPADFDTTAEVVGLKEYVVSAEL